MEVCVILFEIEKCLNEREAAQYSPITLAYIGDAVYSLLVRTWLIRNGDRRNCSLHVASIRFVSAAAQAKTANMLLSSLTEGETSIFRRGRNAKSNVGTRKVNVFQYKTSTGVEAVFGYLYLTGNSDRINELFEKIIAFSSAEKD